MKKVILIILIIITMVGGYFGYKYYEGKRLFHSWLLIPKNAAFVYESTDIVSIWNSVVSTKMWEGTKSLPLLNTVNNSLIYLDSLSGSNGQLDKYLKGSQVLISTHVISKVSSDQLFIVPLGSGKRKENVLASVYDIISKSVAEITTRKYQEFEINEANHFSFIIYNNHFIGSATPFLVEDVIRNINSSFENNFLTHNPKLLSSPKLQTDQGNLYINNNNIADYFRTLIAEDDAVPQLIGRFSESLFLDLTIGDKNLLLSGFAKGGVGDKDLMKIFAAQEPVRMGIQSMVPSNAASVMHFGFQDADKWYSGLKLWREILGAAFFEKIDGFAKEAFVGNIGNELALVNLESLNPESGEKLLIIHLKDIESGYNKINTLAEQISAKEGDSLYIENYADTEIRLLESTEFPEKLFGKLFKGFPVSAYTIFNNYLVIGNSTQTIRQLLNSIDSEDTWGKSKETSDFLEDNLDDANFTLLVSTDRYWNYLKEKLNNASLKVLIDNADEIKSFDLLSLQISNLDNQYYINLSVDYREHKGVIEGEALKEVASIQLNSPIIKKPKVVRNHNTGALEFLVQDSTNNISLINQSGQLLWTNSLPEPIVSEIYQIDYYANKKLQYLFATESAMYLIDRNGRKVSGFPVYTKSPARDLFVIDYDKSKNYRFLIGNSQGDLIMYNKEGGELNGWRPKSFNSNLYANTFHIRVRGKDRIIVPQQNGFINVTTRRGAMAEGFPVDLGINMASNIFTDLGPTFNKTIFTVISEDGQLESFDLEGGVHASTQLVKTAKISKFKLVPEYGGKDYVVSRQEYNRLAVLNRDGELLFDKAFINDGEKTVQYYNFGADKMLFAIRDHSENKLFLYDQEGKLLNSNTPSVDYDISVLYNRTTSECKIFLAHENSIEIKSFAF